MILFYVLGTIIFVAFIGYLFLYKDQQKDKTNLETDWQKFLKAKSNNDIKGIKDYGNLLVYNKYLRLNQLQEISSTVNSRHKDYPDLEKLKNAILNKKLHYNRPLPYPGGSGGKKQSW